MQKRSNQWLSDAQENLAAFLCRCIYKNTAHFNQMSEMRRNYCRVLAFDIMNGATRTAIPIEPQPLSENPKCVEAAAIVLQKIQMPSYYSIAEARTQWEAMDVCFKRDSKQILQAAEKVKP